MHFNRDICRLFFADVCVCIQCTYCIPSLLVECVCVFFLFSLICGAQFSLSACQMCNVHALIPLIGEVLIRLIDLADNSNDVLYLCINPRLSVDSELLLAYGWWAQEYHLESTRALGTTNSLY